MAVDRDETLPRRRPCIRCDTCDGFPCLVDAKCDAQVTRVDRALAHPSVTLRVTARATRLLTNAAGTEATHVEADVGGRLETFGADVVVACGAINSAALLLRSANDTHPRGLANSSDQVGRDLMLHNSSAMLAVSATTANPTRRFTRPSASTTSTSGPDVGYPLGHV
jgi:choline dehydrogenase-like flavoprotein